MHIWTFTSFVYLFSFCFLRWYRFLGHMEVPRLGVKSELQLPAYTTATAKPEPSCICDLHHSSQQCRILNPLNEARDRTFVLMDTSQIPFRSATMGTPRNLDDLDLLSYFPAFSFSGKKMETIYWSPNIFQALYEAYFPKLSHFICIKPFQDR